MDDERQEEELEEIEIEDEDEGEGEEPEEKPATYKELVSRVAVLSKMPPQTGAGCPISRALEEMKSGLTPMLRAVSESLWVRKI